MKLIALAITAALAACATTPTAEGRSTAPPAIAVTDCGLVEADGTRTLCHEIVVAAPRAEVWALLSSSEALRTWAAPMVVLDLSIGGMWEASYNSNAALGDPTNIRNRVLSFAPGRMLSLQVDRAPEGFAHPDLVRETWTVIELESIEPQLTKVRVSGMGYREGWEFDELYRFFDEGNSWTLRQLQQRIVQGPIDWNVPRAPAYSSSAQ